MSSCVIATDAEALRRIEEADKSHTRRSREMRVLQNLIKGNPLMLFRLCEVGALDGHRLDPECCAPIPEKLIYKIMGDFTKMLIEGIPHADDLGEDERYQTPCWMCGCFGSRWIDLDASKYGLDHIRVAYYTKSEDSKLEKPHCFQITCEKAR
jgi:hypothetical protein